MNRRLNLLFALSATFCILAWSGYLPWQAIAAVGALVALAVLWAAWVTHRERRMEDRLADRDRRRVA